MALVLISDGENWGPRSSHAYHYIDGRQGNGSRLKVEFAENLTSTSGLFTKLTDEDVKWKLWNFIEKIPMALFGVGRQGAAPRALRGRAKQEPDHSRIIAPNRGYRSIWPGRTSDMAKSMAADMDTNCPVAELTQFYREFRIGSAAAPLLLLQIYVF